MIWLGLGKAQGRAAFTLLHKAICFCATKTATRAASHTTRHTGPYHGGSRVWLTRTEQGQEAERSELSPLLSNVVLDELDRELERRGHRFVRYADDANI